MRLSELKVCLLFRLGQLGPHACRATDRRVAGQLGEAAGRSEAQSHWLAFSCEGKRSQQGGVTVCTLKEISLFFY